MKATLALGFEPLPYLYWRARQAGRLMSGPVIGCRLRSGDGPSKGADEGSGASNAAAG